MSVSFDGDTIGYCTDFELQVNKEPIDITTLSATKWKEFLVDLCEWKVSGSGLVTYGTPGASEIGSEGVLTSLLDTDTAATLIMTSGESGDQYISGSAFLVSFSKAAQVGDKQTFNFEFQGTGELTDPTEA